MTPCDPSHLWPRPRLLQLQYWVFRYVPIILHSQKVKVPWYKMLFMKKLEPVSSEIPQTFSLSKAGLNFFQCLFRMQGVSIIVLWDLCRKYLNGLDFQQINSKFEISQMMWILRHQHRLFGSNSASIDKIIPSNNDFPFYISNFQKCPLIEKPSQADISRLFDRITKYPPEKYQPFKAH